MTTRTPTASSSVRRERMPLEQSYTFENQVQVTVEDVRLANTISTDESTEIEPGQDSRFLLVQVSSKNVGEGQVDLAGGGEFAAILGTTQREPSRFDSFSSPTRIQKPVSGELYAGKDGAFSGVRTSGWLVFKIPRSAETATIAWGREGYEDSAQAYWNAELNTESLPNVQISSVDIPETAERYKPLEATVTLTNSGGSEGTYIETFGEDVYSSPVQVNWPVPAGETVTETLTLPYTDKTLGGAREDITISLAGTEYTVSYTEPTRKVGNSFTTQLGLQLTAFGIETGDELRTYSSFSEQYEEERLSDGNRWVFVQVEVANTSDQTISAPSPSTFSVVDNGADVGTLTYPSTLSNTSREFRGTLSGTPYNPTTKLASGERLSGWLVYEVPLQSLDDMGVSWEASINYSGESSPKVTWEQN